MDFLGQLTNDYYEQFFPQSEVVPASELDSFYARVANDAGATVQEIKDIVTASASEIQDGLTYQTCKTALLTHFTPLSPELRPVDTPSTGQTREPEEDQSRESRSIPRTSDVLDEQFLADAPDGHMELIRALDLFQGFQSNRSDFGSLDRTRFRECLLGSVTPVMKVREKSTNVHRRYMSQPSEREVQVTLEEFKEAVKKWETQKNASHSVAERLKASIQEYREAISLLSTNPSQVKAIEGIIATLEKQLQTFEPPQLPSEALARKLQEQQKKSLVMIFGFYCKQQTSAGPKPTFEDLSTAASHWNLGKFVKFAIDFKLAGRLTDANTLSKDDLKTIFLMTCDGRRKMNFEQFLKALNSIAERWFDTSYDVLHGTKMAQKSPEDKKELLYLELGLENPKTIAETMKRFGPAFSVEKDGYRLPEYDPARHYRLRQKAADRQDLKEWRARKVIQTSGVSALRSSTDSSKFGSVPSDAVAIRRPPATNYTEQYQMRHNAVSVTWQALSQMQYSDINVGDNIGDLIGVSAGGGEEDLLEKQYGLGKFSQPGIEQSTPQSAATSVKQQKSITEQKLEGLMRLHEKKVARGLNVLKRTNVSKSANNSVSNKV